MRIAIPVLIMMMSASAALADGPATQPSDLVGKPAPDFSLSGLKDGTHSLAEAKGHVLVLDFWGVWCVPCHEALPHVDALYHDKSKDGVMVFAIDEQDEKDQAAKYIGDAKLTLPVLLDPDSKASDAYKLDEYPQTVVIGKDGVVKNVFIGFNPKSSPGDLEKAVEAAMAAK